MQPKGPIGAAQARKMGLGKGVGFLMIAPSSCQYRSARASVGLSSRSASQALIARKFEAPRGETAPPFESQYCVRVVSRA